MKLECKFEKKVSKKTNAEYYVLIVKLCEGVEKMVILEKSEAKLLELLSK